MSDIRAGDWTDRYAPPGLRPYIRLARLDRPMEARVDDPSGGCNAYWNGTRLNFYAAGGGCVSTARIADVVFHEYGHAVTQDCYQPWDPPGDMNEGYHPSNNFPVSFLPQGLVIGSWEFSMIFGIVQSWRSRLVAVEKYQAAWSVPDLHTKVNMYRPSASL